MSTTFYILLGLSLLVSFLLVIVIMVQNPKGGGLSSSFGGGGTQQLGGVKKTGDFLDKSTWVLSTLLLVLILLAGTVVLDRNSAVNDIIDENNVSAPAALSTPPAATPAADATETDSPE